MTYATALAALSDPTRRAVFEALAAQPRAVSELARDLPVSRPAVSQHLKVLSDAGLVQGRSQGRRRIYTLRAAGLEELRAYLDRYWDRALAQFAQAVRSEVSKED